MIPSSKLGNPVHTRLSEEDEMALRKEANRCNRKLSDVLRIILSSAAKKKPIIK